MSSPSGTSEGNSKKSTLKSVLPSLYNDIECPILQTGDDFEFIPKGGSFKIRNGEPIEGELHVKVYKAIDFGPLLFYVEGTVQIGGETNVNPHSIRLFNTELVTICGKSPRLLQPGEHKLPIKTEPIKCKNLPATFKNSFVNIEYKWHMFLIFELRRRSNGEKHFCGISGSDRMNFKGYYDFTAEPKLLKPFTLLRKNHDGSFFSMSKPNLEAGLNLNKKAFIAGETIAGTLAIENQKGLCVQTMSVRCIQRTSHLTSSGMRKVATRHVAEMHWTIGSQDRNIQWELELNLPKDLMPTFRKIWRYWEIFYLLQFTVQTQGLSDLKGETEVVIGSNPDDLNGDQQRAGCDSKTFHMLPLSKNGSAHSSQTSLLPPKYSALSSRCSSMSTLPPAYGSLLENFDPGDFDWEKNE